VLHIGFVLWVILSRPNPPPPSWQCHVTSVQLIVLIAPGYCLLKLSAPMAPPFSHLWHSPSVNSLQLLSLGLG